MPNSSFLSLEFGGPNWVREYRAFYLEVGRKSKTHQSYAYTVRSNILSGSNRIPIGKKVDQVPKPHRHVPVQHRRSVFYRISYFDESSKAKNTANLSAVSRFSAA